MFSMITRGKISKRNVDVKTKSCYLKINIVDPYFWFYFLNVKDLIDKSIII